MARICVRRGILLLAVICLGIFRPATANVTVAENDSHDLTATENVSGKNTDVELSNGSTLRISSSLGADVVLRANVKILAGAAATLSVGEGVSSLRLEGGLYALDGASLAVTGIGTVSMGKSMKFDAINSPPLDIENLTFSDANATGLVLADSVTIRHAPTNTCPLSISSGANLALFGTNSLAPFGISGNFTLSDFDVVLLGQEAIGTNCTVTVNPGRTLAIKPCNKNGDWAWAGRVGTFSTPRIVLGGQGSRCLFRAKVPTTFESCPVSGEGEVAFRPDDEVQTEIMLYGPFEYNGVFSVQNGSSLQTYSYAWGEGTRSLCLSNNATYRPNGVVSFSSLSIDRTATLELIHNSDLTIGTIVSGTKLRLVAGGGIGGGHANFTGSFPSPFTIETDGTAFCRFNGGDPTAGMECATESGITYLFPDASGVIDCLGLSLGRGHPYATLFTDGAVLTNLPSSVNVLAKGSASLATTSTGASIRSEAGKTVSYVSRTADWRNSDVLLWIDPSTAEFIPVGGHDANKASVEGNVVFANIRDVRASQTTYSLWNRRDTGKDKSKINWQVFPLAVPNGYDGKTYISLGEYQKSKTQTYVFDDGSASVTKSTTVARRILFANGTDVTATAPTEAGAVTMVFGSQNGGGMAIVGTLSGAFCRAGTTLNHGITTNTVHRIFVNGSLVADPATQKFSGGWDVITVEMDGEKLSAFGWGGGEGGNNDYTHCGGQNYGEIIVFKNVPSDGDRMSAERYLAEKWGLSSKYAVFTNDVVLSGSGTVRMDGQDANVSGRFNGTIDLSGGMLTFAPRGAVPDESSVPTAALAGWFDPDDENNILLNKDSGYDDAATNPNLLWAVYDKSKPARADGDPVLYGSVWRRPRVRRTAHGDGPLRNWIYFETYNGCNLRFEQLPLPTLGSNVTTAVALTGVREMFVVQDSARGGGTPVVDKINADSANFDGMKILPRRTAYAYEPIWASKNNFRFTDATVTGGVARLNGTVVDGMHAGFTGHDEVFSFTTTAPYDPIALADVWNISVAGSGAYEMIGETLFFSEVLSDQDRQNVIDYLNAKWRGVLPAGCGDFSGATVTGTGSVRGQDMAHMPRPSSAFSGSFVVSENADCAFAVSVGDGVEDPLVAPGTTFGFPPAATVTVTVTGKVPSGIASFDLIDCAGFIGTTEWTLNLVSAAGAHGTLKTQGGKLILDLFGPGTIITFR